MASPEDDDVIEARTTNADKMALARCIHKRSPYRRSYDFHSSTFRHSAEFSAALVIVITNDHTGTLAERSDITKLLRRPLFSRCSRDSNVNDFAGLNVDHKKSEQRTKPNIVDLQDVGGPNRVVCEKRLPSS